MSGRFRLFVVLACLLGSVLLYQPVLDGDWVFDDVRLVSTNDWLWRSFEGFQEELDQWRMVLQEPASSADQVRVGFRPLRFFSYRIDALLTMAMGVDGPAVEGATRLFHLHNMLLHGLCAALVFLLVFRIYPAGGRITAVVCSLLFLVHPVQSEAVAWISGRRDVLFACAYLGALLIAVSGGKQPGWGRGMTVALLAATAMAAKEMAATLPVALIAAAALAWDGPTDRAQWRRWSRVLLPTAVVILLLSYRVLALQHPGAGTSYWGGSADLTFWTMGRALLQYLGLFLWPVGLSVDHSHAAFVPSTSMLAPWTSLASWLVIASVAAVSVRRALQGQWMMALVVGLFIVLLSPVLQIFPHPERFAERFMYLPLVVLLIPVAAALNSFEQRSPGSRLPVLLVLVMLLTLLTRNRLEDWHGPYELWSSAVASQPRCARAWFGHAEAARKRQWDSEAVADLARTIEILEEVQRDRLQQGIYLQALQIRSGLLARFGGEANLELARDHLTTLLSLQDTDGSEIALQETPWRESLKVRERLGDFEGARVAALTLVDLVDSRPAVRLEAMLYLAATTEPSEQQQRLEQAQRLAEAIGPRALATVAYQSGMIALDQKRFEQALGDFDRSLVHLDEEGRRGTARYRRAECMLGLGRTTDAREALEQLLEDDPSHLASHLSLGELLLASDQIDAALEHFQRVLMVVPDNPQALQGIQHAAILKQLKEGPAVAQLDPTRITALTMLADKMLSKGDPDKARVALVEAMKHAEGPDEKVRRVELILRISRLDAEQGQWPLAFEGYQRLIEMVEVSERGHFILEAAEVLRRIEGTEAALEMLTQQQSEGVLESRLYRQMGAMAHQLGMNSLAAKWYRRHLAEFEDEDPAMRARIEAALEEVLQDDSRASDGQGESR